MNSFGPSIEDEHHEHVCILPSVDQHVLEGAISRSPNHIHSPLGAVEAAKVYLGDVLEIGPEIERRAFGDLDSLHRGAKRLLKRGLVKTGHFLGTR